MSDSRIDLAFPAQPAERLLLIGARASDPLAAFDPARTEIIQGHFPDHRALAARGFRVSPDASTGPADVAMVFLPRSKAEARARIAAAVKALPDGAALWIDGQKTDGVDAILREIKALTSIGQVHSKAHGKIFSLRAGSWLPDAWAAQPHQVAPGFQTLPGVFSADGVDPGSALLAGHLPDRLPTRLVDLGAGWGWLAAQALARPGPEVVHLVEADHAALESARANIADPRAQFHWADARDFTLSEPVNGVLMNPPFHDGRAADPGLGRAFIATAARLLTGAGRMWMVANRHLPYEAELNRHFGQWREIASDSRYKIIEATGARRNTAGKR